MVARPAGMAARPGAKGECVRSAFLLLLSRGSLLSHPSRKNKYAARMGHPKFYPKWRNARSLTTRIHTLSSCFPRSRKWDLGHPAFVQLQTVKELEAVGDAKSRAGTSLQIDAANVAGSLQNAEVNIEFVLGRRHHAHGVVDGGGNIKDAAGYAGS